MTNNTTEQELAKLCREFIAHSNLTQKRASELLGIPQTTFEYILAGRGFRYPRLLINAITRFTD